MAAQLAQLGERWPAEWEVMGSNPGWNQQPGSFQKTDEIMLPVI